ncbi:MAG: M20 metallopeptidase family protein [Planctomycetota bacterium]
MDSHSPSSICRDHETARSLLAHFRAVAILVACMAATAFAESPAYSTYRDDLADEVSRMAADNLSDWLDYYRDLHAHPELSLEETETARKLAARLTKAGYTVQTGIGGHGVAGVMANGDGPTVLIRGDMDALPITEETGLPYASKVMTEGSTGHAVGVMHACGHDVHQTCLAGTAELLAAMKARWRGTVVIIGQPAEEIGKGALMMIEDGLFQKVPRPDFCIALHVSAAYPAGTLTYTPGWALANVDSVDITIHGMGGHGSRPSQAIDPIVAAAHVTVALQTVVSRRLNPLAPGVITVGSIHSGSKHNIIPDEANMQLTVRSYTDDSRRVLLDGIRDVTRHVCRAMGCTKDPLVHVREDEHTPSTFNDPMLADAAGAVFRKIVGKDRVIEQSPVMGGEDFGRYPKHLEVPGLIFWLGAVRQDAYDASRQPGGAPLPSLHSSKFAPDPEPTITTGVKSMTSLALSLLATP